MFPTFISILDIQSWWEVPSIAHFCSLFRTAFNLLDFDIEDLEEALLTDGTEETSWLQELIVRLLSGCLPSNEISTFNYQMFLRRLFRQKCQEHDIYNPFNTDIDFQLLPLRTKVDILQCLCDFRLDADDVLDQLKNLEADSLRVVPLGYDSNDSAYWYFYGTRLYREDFKTKNNKKKSIWQVICFTEDDWFQLTKKFKKSTSKAERQLHNTLSENFLPELPRLFKEKERLARKRLLENQPRRTSSRLRKEAEGEEKEEKETPTPEVKPVDEEEERQKKRELDKKRREEAYERRAKLKEQSEDSQSEVSESRYEMAGAAKNKKSKARQRKSSTCSNSSKDTSPAKSNNKRGRKSDKEEMPTKVAPKPTTVGRQTNNSLSAATGQIVIQSVSNTNKKKLKTSQVFRQTEEDLQVGMHKILDFVKNHEDAWPFADPVEEEYAPNYYSIIRKPMDLQKMEERLDSGFYKSYSKFKADFQLIVNNCRLYNGAENEYTEMVDNLLKVFESATEKYLDQISSSDDEIAVEYLENEAESKTTKKKPKVEEVDVKKSKRKPALAAQTDKKKERSPSVESLDSFYEDEKPEKKKKVEKTTKKPVKNSKSEKTQKEGKKRSRSVSESSLSHKSDSESDDYKSSKSKNTEDKTKKVEKSKKEKIENKKTVKNVKESKNNVQDAKKSKDSVKENKADKKKSVEKEVKASKGKKIKTKKDRKASTVRKRSLSRSLSRSPPPSNVSSPPPSWPPSSPESRFDFSPKKSGKRKLSKDLSDEDLPNKVKQKKQERIKSLFDDDCPAKHVDKKIKKDNWLKSTPLSPKPKDKHNKLRETIEKLKAKSEISNKIKVCEYDFQEDDLPKENKDKMKKEDKDKFNKSKPKDKSKSLKKDKNLDMDDGTSTLDSVVSENKKGSKKKSSAQSTPNRITNTTNKNIEIEALTLATEQTLKDINKWLDDTPKFSEFSSASNSPSYGGLDDFDSLNSRLGDDIKKKLDKPAMVKKDPSQKDVKKRPFRDPTKLFSKRREIQRTIDRLQPGKSKGNLISNVPNVNKVDELFPLGPLSKIKDTKNSLIVKTDTNAPKLSLGSVLDSFGKHKFVDDQKKEEEKVEVKKPEVTPVLQDSNIIEEKEKKEVKESVEPKEEVIVDDSVGGATPNLSAWFKAFGAPKMQPPVKKSDLKPDGKENEEKPTQKVPVPDPSPSLDSPVQGGQPVPRQRRISTGSSMSERSSFSQDMDSPRVGIDERLAYPAPYPSPMHRSPSGASPIMASPRPDVSPKSAAYPPFNGQMRVGFYQDTVSTKSSPDKSCSPRDNPQSPYPQYSEHIYTPNTTQNAAYSYTNSPYYTHPPNYSSTNPTPPYNTESSSSAYYDTSKSLTDQYQKPLPNYSANSPASNISSPASHSQHSPNVHSPSLHSPNVHSPNVLSPNVNSPKMQIANVQSPNVQSPSMDNYQQEEPVKQPEKVQSTMFPVKKRYTDAELKQFKQYPEQDETINRNLQLGEQLNLGTSAGLEKESAKYVHQNIPEPKSLTTENVNKSAIDYNKQTSMFPQSQPNIASHQQQQSVHQQQQPPQNDNVHSIRNYPNATNPYYPNDSNYPLNIPSARSITSVPQQELERKIDLSKYTNMGYSGPDVNFSRNLPQQYNRPPDYPRSTPTQQASEPSQTPQTNDILRYANPNMLSQISYKNREAPAVDATQSHPNYSNPTVAHQNTRVNEAVTNRLTPSQQAAEVSIPKPTYNAPSIAGNIANLSHIVDRYGNDERMLSGLQSSTASYYSDKGLAAPHMFNKPISSGSSALPMFSQANIQNMQSQYQGMQATASSMYNRQMNELQNPNIMSNEAKAQNLAASSAQAKKAKKPKYRKTATPTIATEQPQQSSSNQGFQSYAGLKAGNASIEPSAISLKTSSVVSGSAFSFGPTATGLGIGGGLYGAPDKDSYPNFLDEFGRQSSNYYMAAAAAHHRSTPEANDKQTRAHQATSAQTASYPFLGAPQVRPPGYPIGAPFIPSGQAQLMDTSSPIYQHYLQAGVLNQGLLGPPGAYPPGYHAALSMRQPYDSMTRPSWL